VIAQVDNGPVLLVGKECAEAGLPADGALEGFTASGVLLVPFRARHVQRGIALFADDRVEREVIDAVDVLSRASELLRVRLDTVALLFELKLLNAELDLKVADRTRALSASQERLRIAIDAASLATWEWDVEAREVEWSGVAGLLGAEELPGTIEAYLGRVHPDDRAGVAATFARARRTADPQRIEHRVVTRHRRSSGIIERRRLLQIALGERAVAAQGRDAAQLERGALRLRVRAEEARLRLRDLRRK
jgi:PAS domain-containing protein